MFVSGEGRDANLCIVASPKKFLAFFDRGKDTAGKYLDAARQRRKEVPLLGDLFVCVYLPPICHVYNNL